MKVTADKIIQKLKKIKECIKSIFFDISKLTL